MAAPVKLPVADKLMPMTPNAKFAAVQRLGNIDLFIFHPPNNRFSTNYMLSFCNANVYI